MNHNEKISKIINNINLDNNIKVKPEMEKNILENELINKKKEINNLFSKIIKEEKDEHLKPFKINLIAAFDKNHYIGKNNEIPWHLPEDFKWFKKNTLNHTVIMGRNTYLSIGKPLPNRTNIVITSKDDIKDKNIIIAKNINDAKDKAIKHNPAIEEVFIIGGESIYNQYIEYADKLFLTYIEANIDGDARFPFFNKNEWVKIFSKKTKKNKNNKYNMEFVIFEKAK